MQTCTYWESRYPQSVKMECSVLPSSSQLQLFAPDVAGEDPSYLQDQIITYIGNKRSLLPFIGEGLKTVKRRLGKSRLRALDLFAGSGIVSRFLKYHAEHIIANDLESYSKITNECYLTNPSSVDLRELQCSLSSLKNRIEQLWAPGFITDLYAPKDESNITADDRVFYTRRNAIYLDAARTAIAELPANLQKYFLAPLLASASIHANTSGVFKGFYKARSGIGQFGGSGRNALTRIFGEIEVALPVFSRFDCPFQVFHKDANTLIGELDELDVAYLDPPYNQHPYGSNYFMLNLLVDYCIPTQISRISGIPTDWNRSRYNKKKEAEHALFDIIERCPAKFILISYNSEGFISYDSFVSRLQDYGHIAVLETSYNTFRGSRNLRERPIHVKEFLFLLERH